MAEAPIRAEILRSVLSEMFSPVAGELADVERRLETALRHRDPFIDDLVRHSFHIGGKRLRPALLLLAGKAVGDLCDAHLILATVVEMIHTATLVHDDVLDEATVRRHAATVNARWGNVSSVLLGDYIFSHAFCMASSLDSLHGSRVIGEATNIVCEGELRQTASIGNFWLSREDYIEIIDAKTAALCSCCCRLGGFYANAPEETIESLARFGTQLGIAFQIADDLLDIEGSESTVGKSLGTDLSHQKLTPPAHPPARCPPLPASRIAAGAARAAHGREPPGAGPVAREAWLARPRPPGSCRLRGEGRRAPQRPRRFPCQDRPHPAHPLRRRSLRMSQIR